jgi:uncharacterized protein with PQ loop repeat
MSQSLHDNSINDYGKLKYYHMEIDVLAYIAGIILMISYLPQLIKTFKHKSVEDLSLLMLLATFISSVLYEIYAYILKLIPVVLNERYFLHYRFFYN